MKTFFAVLTDERNGALFSHDERQIIKRHVPWTRVVADVSTAHYDQPVDLYGDFSSFPDHGNSVFFAIVSGYYCCRRQLSILND